MSNDKTVTGVDYAIARIKKGDGSLLREEIVRRGQSLPSDVTADEVERLTALGVFGDPAGALDEAGAARALAAAAGAPEGKAITPDGRTVDLPPETDPRRGAEVPARNGSLETWQTYARTRGATDDDLDGKTRDELRELYGE